MSFHIIVTRPRSNAKAYSIIMDYLGTPTHAFDSHGAKVWERNLDIYGKIRAGDSTLVPFLFQGQYFDEETDLCYNRFRYYSPGTGLYISQDPVGLAGGMALYSYVHDLNSWIDPLGLRPTNPFDVVPYKPSSSPLENHHGILDVWAANNIDGYKSRASHNPTIALTKEQHDATKAVYRDWLKEKTGKPVGGKIDWTKVSAREAQHLSERMFDAAKVPQHTRDEYYRKFN